MEPKNATGQYSLWKLTPLKASKEEELVLRDKRRFRTTANGIPFQGLQSQGSFATVIKMELKNAPGRDSVWKEALPLEASKEEELVL